MSEFPPDLNTAAYDLINYEQAIDELVGMALTEWLPYARGAVLAAADAPPPDPAAVADTQNVWDYVVDAIIVYGVYLLAAAALDKATTALTAVQLAAGEALAQLAYIPSFGSLPSRDTLARRVYSVVGAQVIRSPAETLRRVNSVPELHEFAGDMVEQLRGRLPDVVGRVYDRTARTVQDSPTNDEARAEVTDDLDDLSTWRPVAAEVAQSQTTTILNAATAEAARIAQRDYGFEIEQRWVATLDAVTRDAHIIADGQTRALGETFDVGGEQLRRPGDPRGSIENTINCRCRLFVVFIDPAPRASATETLGIDPAPTTQEFAVSDKFRTFSSVLAVIDTPTDDGRLFDADIDLRFRSFPLPLMWQKQSDGGHMRSYTVGVIESAEVVGKKVVSAGYMLNSPEADEAMDQITHGVTAPSVDLGDTEWEFRDDKGNPLSEDDWWDPDVKIVEVVTSAKLLGATLVSIPAFGETSITLGEFVERTDSDAVEQEASLVAAAVASRYAQPVHEASFFTRPELADDELDPHITDAGRIQGYLALWNVCHTGIADRCQLAPRSSTDYAWFHTSPPVKTDKGKVKVGRLTVVTDPTKPGHADGRLGAAPAIAHYDNVGTCYGLVVMGEDERGIWFSGIPAPGATPDMVHMGLSAPLSGDWRTVGGSYELVAALAVNHPGFPTILASGASDEHGDPISLIASFGPCPSADKAPMSVTAIAKAVIAEMRLDDRRSAEALALVAEMDRREQALVLIDEIED